MFQVTRVCGHDICQDDCPGRFYINLQSVSSQMSARRFSTCVYDTLEEPKKKSVLRTVEWSSVVTLTCLWIYVVEEFIRQGRKDHVNLFGIHFIRGSAIYNLWVDHLVIISVFAILHVTCILISRQNNFMKSLFGYENISKSTELPLAILKGFFYTLIIESSSRMRIMINDSVSRKENRHIVL